MGKKLKKDFKERQRARIEKERLQSNSSIEPEENKLKHNDDYRGKIIHEKDRFQDKVHEKTSKMTSDSEPVRGTSKRNARYRASNKDSITSSTETGGVSQEEIGKADYGTEVKDGKIYDPLGKDLDNDGIIDRYDNDFRDSDYFESTYDVEDNLHTKEEATQKTGDKPSILGQIRAYQNESKTEEKQKTKEQEILR